MTPCSAGGESESGQRRGFMTETETIAAAAVTCLWCYVTGARPVTADTEARRANAPWYTGLPPEAVPAAMYQSVTLGSHNGSQAKQRRSEDRR
jgi:hypothetical protein